MNTITEISSEAVLELVKSRTDDIAKYLDTPEKHSDWRRVIVESPYAGDIELNLKYIRACMRDCLLRGEAPYASHALYTQEGVLCDEIPEERRRGISAGLAWKHGADSTVVYLDLGWSKGMREGVAYAQELGQMVEERYLGPDWEDIK